MQKHARAKFDESVEVAMNLGIDTRRGDSQACHLSDMQQMHWKPLGLRAVKSAGYAVSLYSLYCCMTIQHHYPPPLPVRAVELGLRAVVG